ncbi:MAG TPA: ArsC/Spx/MgsR family protein [Candidatus Binataceae bacterium]|jgi:arsenate reductase|nr:ArsC/Spx/MgsR family protein [Candidatus Binataceae bacterium]
MEHVTLYHNPACSHSRAALGLLQERGVAFATIEYLKTPPDRAALEQICDRLGEPLSELVRKDKRFAELQLNAADYVTRAAVIDLLLAYPELMQRPIVIRGERAVIARPATLLERLF